MSPTNSDLRGARSARTRRVWAVAALAVAVGTAVAGCSSSSDGPGREYAVPAKVCGVPVPGSALEPLLPGGKKLVSESSGSNGLRTCKLSVDGKLAVTARVERWEHGTSFQKVLAATPGLGGKQGPASGDTAVASGSTGLAKVACPGSAPDGEEVFATFRAENSPGEPAMSKAVTAYAAKAGTATNCRS
jgi:hypothetical protein